MLKDILDGLKVVSDGVESIKTIIEAIKSGKDYIKAKHPDVKSDIQSLVIELQKSLLIIKRASAVLTNFRFAVSIDMQGKELTRFNDYFINSKTEAQLLENHIDDLRTHCSKIRDHANRIVNDTTVSGFTKIFTLLGLNSPEREKMLGEQLNLLAYEDFNISNSAVEMLKCLTRALTDIQNALGNGGAMYTENIPLAAELLSKYGKEFDKNEEQAAQAVKEIRELISELK